MEVEQIIIQMRAKMTGAIHCIATKEYAKILEYVKLDDVQKIEGKSDIECMQVWEEVINGQIAICEEDNDDNRYSVPIKVDEFDENLCEDDLKEFAEELIEEGETCISYNLYSNKEEIDNLMNEFRVELNQEKGIEIFWSMNG